MEELLQYFSSFLGPFCIFQVLWKQVCLSQILIAKHNSFQKESAIVIVLNNTPKPVIVHRMKLGD